MKNVQIKLGERDDAFEVRRAVFMDEQGYENEIEALDDNPACIHVTAYLSGELVGCARTFPHATELALDEGAVTPPACAFDEGADAGSIYVMGRVAVLAAYRRRGIAHALVEASEAAAHMSGARVMKLHAQEYVHNLYIQHGYTQISEVDYEDEGQPHLWMAKLL